MKTLTFALALFCTVALQAGDACCGTCGGGKKAAHKHEAKMNGCPACAKEGKACAKCAAKKSECAACAKEGKPCAKCAAKKSGCPACAKEGKPCAKCAAMKAHAAVSTKDLAARLDGDDKPVVLDARGAKGYAAGHIPGAKHLAAGTDEATVKKVVGDDKSVAIVTYCSNLKCGASKMLATQLRKLGYTNVTEYPEGFAGWKEAGNKVDKAD